ncbi:flagellar associated protein [Cyclospora cayetanensis]|uniref:Flagellar associated protein n=1 Tax=Cyclospora cayetanensis TaxID=88456 RepID=A0A1D3D1V4_9EIME|nr:flagellar associated protein [Cyclospora cayetanensis]
MVYNHIEAMVYKDLEHARVSQDSTAMVLQNALQPQKELLEHWMEDAIDIQKQEALQNLEREIGEHESFLKSSNDLLLSYKWEMQDTDEALEAARHTLESTHEDLAALQQKRIDTIERYFAEKSQALKRSYVQSIREIKTSHGKFVREIQTLIQLIREEEQMKATEETQDLCGELSFLTNRSIEAEHQLQSQLDQTIKALKGQIETAMQNHAAATEGQAQEFRRLSAQDSALTKQVEEKARQIERMQTAINHWKAKVAQSKQDFESRNSRIRAEVDCLRKHCKELRDEMEGAKDLEKQCLTELSLCARERKDALLEQLKLANKIHRMAKLCRKYERQEASEEPAQIEPTDQEVASWTPESRKLYKALKKILDSEGDDPFPLQNFFRKISEVTLEAAVDLKLVCLRYSYDHLRPLSMSSPLISVSCCRGCLQHSLSLLSGNNKAAKASLKDLQSSLSLTRGAGVEKKYHAEKALVEEMVEVYARLKVAFRYSSRLQGSNLESVCDTRDQEMGVSPGAGVHNSTLPHITAKVPWRHMLLPE